MVVHVKMSAALVSSTDVKREEDGDAQNKEEKGESEQETGQ